MPLISSSVADCCLQQIDLALRSAAAVPISDTSKTPIDFPPDDAKALQPIERALSIALIRVDHVGEVCAQALYQAQALASREPHLKHHFRSAAAEEQQHLNWTAMRLKELGGRPSYLNPLWYGGAFALGLLAGRLGDAVSLGFVTETERQVEAHLSEHLERLPQQDQRSRAILLRMREDEVRHAANAQAAGGQEIPRALRWGMKILGKIMTRTAEKI
jgi:ubiquinone biosynthesis monooxygenase Coq7